MFSHVMIGSNDIQRSKQFYDALFAAIGAKPGRQDEKGRLVYAHKGAAFIVTKPIDGKPATHANGGTIGFIVDSPAASASSTSPISAIPTATSSARCIGRGRPHPLMLRRREAPSRSMG
jgi:catechol 2,3-dioxygenase-like lactoylglutathione lyase family enzyme